MQTWSDSAAPCHKLDLTELLRFGSMRQLTKHVQISLNGRGWRFQIKIVRNEKSLQ